jgi:hypothetical protein
MVVSGMSLRLRMSFSCMYQTDSRKSVNAEVQETGVHGRKGCFLAEHTTLMAILKLDRYITKFRCMNQRASSFTRKKAGHENATHAPSS